MSTSVQPTPANADPFASYDTKYGAPPPAQATAPDAFSSYDKKYGPADPFAAYDQKYAKPGVLQQVKGGLSEVGQALASPWQTIKGMAKSAGRDFVSTFATPVVGTRNELNAKTGLPLYPHLKVGDTVTAENTPGAIPESEFKKAALHTSINAALLTQPELALPGRLAVNAGAGAAYDPEQPIRGATAGLVLGEGLHAVPGVAARVGNVGDVSQGAVESAMQDYARSASGTSPTEVTARSEPAPGSAAALAMARGKLPASELPTAQTIEPAPPPKVRGKQAAPPLVQPATDYLGGGRTIDKNPLVVSPEDAAAQPSGLVDASGNPVTAGKPTRPRPGSRVPLPNSVTGSDPFDAYDAKYAPPPAPPDPFAAFDAQHPEAAPVHPAIADVQSRIVDAQGQPLAPNEASALLLNHAGSQRVGETLGETGAGQGSPADVGEPQGEGRGPGEPVGTVAPGPGAGQALPGAPAAAQAAPPSLLNERTLNVSPAAQPVLEAAKERLAAEGFQKERVSMGAQRASAADFATQLGISPLDVDPKKIGRMSGPEIERVKELAGQHMDMIAQLSKQLADPSITPAHAAELNSLLDEARDQNHAALQTIVRGSAQIGRDLGYLRQVAQHSLDPDVWVTQAQRLVGDARLSDETIADIRRLAREAADACAAGAA